MSAPTLHDLYRQLDEGGDKLSGANLGFTALVRTASYPMPDAMLEGFRTRYAVIKRFQERTLALFQASLRGECDPEIAAMVLGDVPTHLGLDYHRNLADRQHQSPVFFRTDEPSHGKISEIQCPGSGWCLAEELLTLYRNNARIFGPARHFPDTLAASFANALRKCLARPPVVHHLVDNASRPHGMRYFIQRAREQGIRYYSYDQEVGPPDCNFIRSHDFIILPHHNFFADRMERCKRGEVRFDLPPSALFDGKCILAWPFWRKTRDWYDDGIRALFPYTSVIRPEGVETSDGEWLGLEDFFRMPRVKRNYYIKYAGSDIAINWGSRAVFLGSTLSKAQCHDLMNTIVRDSRQGRSWILQAAMRHQERVSALQRHGDSLEAAAYSKFSGFYGPEGLMAILVMQKPAHKVHGSSETIMSCVL